MHPKLKIHSHFILTMCLPLLGVGVAAALSWRRGAGALELAACVVMFVLTFVGVEVGFHRHFSHRAFKTVRPIRMMLAALGSMAVQGSVVWWGGVHRMHHGHTDRPGDPHSPLDGFLHAHVGWLFTNLDPPGWRHRASDLFRDDVARSATRFYYTWVTIGLLAPAVAVAVASRSWRGLVLGFVWGGLVRLFLVNHIVWSINSVCHRFGTRPYATKDDSRNNVLLSLPSLGFSWHNNHHAYPRAATNAHRWWQLDLCGLLILGLGALGLAWDVRRPSSPRATNTRPANAALPIHSTEAHLT